MADASDDDYEWKRTPAVYVDYYETSFLTDIKLIRIAFGEYTGKRGAPFFRTAIMMPLEDAKMLVESLSGWVKQAENEQTSDKPKETDDG